MICEWKNHLKNGKGLLYNCWGELLFRGNFVNDKLEVLNSGADDYLSEPIDFLEFIGRLKAHLRRNYETQINDVTLLFNNKITTKILKRTLNDNIGYSYLYITIKNIDSYKDLYGDIAYSKMLQTFIAILSSCLDEKDYLGHFNQDSSFLVITSQNKIENIAKYMIYAFNKVKEKFYAKNDLNRGFLILKGDIFEETKTSFVKIFLGGVINSNKKYTNINELVHALVYINKLSALKDDSNYLIERHQLAANDSIVEKNYNLNVMIIENDDSLSLLLETQCKLNDYNVLKEYFYGDAIRTKVAGDGQKNSGGNHYFTKLAYLGYQYTGSVFNQYFSGKIDSYRAGEMLGSKIENLPKLESAFFRGMK